jgi:hypothetical protein
MHSAGQACWILFSRFADGFQGLLVPVKDARFTWFSSHGSSVPLRQRVRAAVPQKLWRKPTVATLHVLTWLNHRDGSACWAVDHQTQRVSQARAFSGAWFRLFQSLFRRHHSQPLLTVPSGSL